MYRWIVSSLICLLLASPAFGVEAVFVVPFSEGTGLALPPTINSEGGTQLYYACTVGQDENGTDVKGLCGGYSIIGPNTTSETTFVLVRLETSQETIDTLISEGTTVFVEQTPAADNSTDIKTSIQAAMLPDVPEFDVGKDGKLTPHPNTTAEQSKVDALGLENVTTQADVKPWAQKYLGVTEGQYNGGSVGGKPYTSNSNVARQGAMIGR